MARINQLNSITSIQSTDIFIIDDLTETQTGTIQQLTNYMEANLSIPTGIGDITGLQAALDGKADEGHTHVIQDVSGLQVELDRKYDSSNARIVGQTIFLGNDSIVIPSSLGGVNDDRIPSTAVVGQFLRFAATNGQVEGRSIEDTRRDLLVNNVDNVSDADKPVSTATQNALDLKLDATRVLTDVPAGALFTDTPTNLSNMASPTGVTIISDTGTNTTLVGATSGQAGLMTNVDKSKLDAIEVSADVTDTANVYAALGINQDTGDINRVLTQTGAYVAVNERILQVTSLAARPREFDVVTRITQLIPGPTLDSGAFQLSNIDGVEYYNRLIDIVLEEFLSESVPIENLELLTLTNTSTGEVIDLTANIGTLATRFGMSNVNSDGTPFGFNWPNNTEGSNERETWATWLDGVDLNQNYRFQARYTVPSPTGAYAAVSNPMYFENDAVVNGAIDTGILRARGCVELFNSASTIWNPTTGTASGTLFGVTNTDLLVNEAGVESLSVVLGLNTATDRASSVSTGTWTQDLVGNYFYFEGFERAGVFRLSQNLLFGLFPDYNLNWSGVESDEFTNGQQEIIPSGTNLRYVESSDDLTEVSFDASIGLIAEPDLVQIHAPTVRMLDIPTDTDPSPILVLDEHSRVRQLDAANLDFSNLPTSDPGITGRLWNDSGTLRIST